MAILSLSLLFLAAISPAYAEAAKSPSCDAQNPCAGTPFDASKQATYLCGDKRLGPVNITADDAPKAVLKTYTPFPETCPGAFLAEYGKDGWLRYPPDDGFNLDANGKPIKQRLTLTPGTLVDRFGAESGAYVSPCGTPYEERSLPPANLVTSPSGPSHPFNYYVYKVVKDFPVLAGPIAPFFGQPGLGEQYKLDFNISMALVQGYLAPHATTCETGGLKARGERVHRVF